MLLVIDQGGSATRGILYDRQGNVLARARRPVATQRPGPGLVEQRPGEIVDSVTAVLAELGRDHALAGVPAALVTQRSSLVCCRRSDGQPLSPLLSWQDTRAADWLAEHLPDRIAVQTITGLRANAHYGLSKMHWCLQRLPAVAAAATADDLMLAPLAAFLHYRLTGSDRWLVDPANASRTLLMNLLTCDWEPALLARFGIAARWLPTIVATRADFGELYGGASLQLLNGDQSAAVFAEGMPAEGAYRINLGTGAFISCRLPLAADIREVAAAGLLASLATVDTDGPVLMLEGTVNGAAAALDWWAQGSGQQLSHRLQQQAWQLSGTVPLFLNTVGGLGSPDWRSDLAPRFVGSGDSLAELRAVLESILFLLCRNLEVMRAIQPPLCLSVSGGLSQQPALCQALADLCQLPVVQNEDPEATARGAAWLLAGDNQPWSQPGMRRFQPSCQPALQRRYREWQQAMSDYAGDPAE